MNTSKVSKKNLYSISKDIFNKLGELFNGYVFHKDGPDNTVIFRFATVELGNMIIAQLDGAKVPYSLLSEKAA